MIPLSVPQIGEAESRYVLECLKSGWVSSAGPFVSRLEELFAAYVGANYAVATSSGTAALHLALISQGVQRGDEVIAPSITFIATLNAIRYCGANPIFFGCDQYFNLDLDSVERFLKERCELRGGKTFNKRSGQQIWGVLPTHVFGNSVDMPRVVAIAETYGLKIVEDAAESVGSRYGSKHTGTFGACGCFSFNGNKIMTTGGGGMIVTESESTAKYLRYLSTQAKDDPSKFIHDEVGYNYRLTNLQAALGVAQLESLGNFLTRKQQLYVRYSDAFCASRFIEVASTPRGHATNNWLTNLRIKPEAKADPASLIAYLKERAIEARPIWWPNHLQKPYLHFERYEVESAEREVARVVSIPSSVGLTDSEQMAVIRAISDWHP